MITVFTPTYNRAYIINNLYKSLCNQSFKDFEWLIVDDGSTDNTKEIIQSYIEEKVIDIRYFKQHNGGKHRAINRGAKEAIGELFFIVDSDDQLPKDSLQNIWNSYLLIHDNPKFVGVCGFDSDFEGNIIGSGMNYDYLECSFRDFRDKYHISGDVADAYKTSILRQYPFPDIPNEFFCAESLIWNRISKKYQILFFNKIIYIANYLQDGLSSNNTLARMKNPTYASLLYSEQLLLNLPFKLKVKTAINYWRFWLCIKNSEKKKILPKIVYLWYLFFPVGVIMYIKDKYSIVT